MMLINKDCFDVLCDLCELDNIDVVITDPPYLHIKGGGKKIEHSKTSSVAGGGGVLSFGSDMMDNMSDFQEEDVYMLLDECRRFMTKMNCFFFCNDTLIPFYCNWANDNKKNYSLLVWEKPLSILAKNRFSQNAEFIVRVYDNGTGLNKLDENNIYSKIMKDKPIRGKEKVHPTQKPKSLIEKLIRLTTNDGCTVLDPFMGSGTTGVVAKALKRNFIGIERDNDYFNIAQERISNEGLQGKLF